MKRLGIILSIMLLLVGCRQKQDELIIEEAYGNYQYEELYYVALQNPMVPDTIESQMEDNPSIIINENQFIFQDKIMENVEYIEDELNNEEKQLNFVKKYKVFENSGDTYYRVYITHKNTYVGVYYNTESLRYIIKVS